MVKNKEEEPEDEEEDDFEELMNEEEPKKNNPSTIPSMKKEDKPEKARFSAYHMPEVHGVFDNSQKKLVYTDLWDVLTSILNNLEEIKAGVG